MAPLALARRAYLPAKKEFTMDFCICGAILNLKAFLNFLSMYA
jgi:hypothetical protein